MLLGWQAGETTAMGEGMDEGWGWQESYGWDTYFLDDDGWEFPGPDEYDGSWVDIAWRFAPWGPC